MTPAMVIQHGSTNLEKVVVGTVYDIMDKARQAKIATPGIIVIGEVVSLHPQYSYSQVSKLMSPLNKYQWLLARYAGKKIKGIMAYSNIERIPRTNLPILERIKLTSLAQERRPLPIARAGEHW